MAEKFFKVPFANEGDRLAVPDVIQADGSISFTQGYGFDYERDQATDPQAKDISRESFNGLLYDITSVLGDIQRTGVQPYMSEITYSKGSIVWFNEELYVSLSNSNTTDPTSSSWVKINDIATLDKKGIVQLTNIIDNSIDKAATPKGVKDYIDEALPIGSILLWMGDVAPKNWIFGRGQIFSSSEYPSLALVFPSLSVPDFRGVVSRGFDTGRGFDPDRVLGSYQEDAIRNIKGEVGYVMRATGSKASGALTDHDPTPSGAGSAVGVELKGFSFDASLVVPTAGENRMKNIATNYIIKAK